MALKEGQGFARGINLKNLQQFAPLLAQKSKGEASVTGDDEQDPADVTASTKSGSKEPDVAKAEALFAGKRFKSPVPFTPPKKADTKRPTAEARSATSGGSRTGTVATAGTHDRGTQRWQKRLSATDAQRQEGNPTGDIRLTQAKWTVNGRFINQTTYFRNEVFGRANWLRKNAEVEEATVEFNVKILGVDHGLHNLIVSHKPSGEASQSNYTTGIQWGDLMAVARQTDLTGRILRLYDPPAGGTAFVLEIV
jgi:hypothetical protein